MTQRIQEPDEIARLWSVYKTEQALDARERLILHYAPLVKFVAGRVGASLPASVDQADLVSYGVLGLIESIERFDMGREETLARRAGSIHGWGLLPELAEVVDVRPVVATDWRRGRNSGCILGP